MEIHVIFKSLTISQVGDEKTHGGLWDNLFLWVITVGTVSMTTYVTEKQFTLT